MSAKDSSKTGVAGFLGQGNALIANMMMSALRPHVPEYANVVLSELGKPETKDAMKKYIKSVLADGAKHTFGNVDMRWYSYILKKHGCADVGACQEQFGRQIAEADTRIQSDYLAVLGSSGLAFLLLLTAGPVLRRSATLVLLLFSLCCSWGASSLRCWR